MLILKLYDTEINSIMHNVDNLMVYTWYYKIYIVKKFNLVINDACNLIVQIG